MNQPGNTQSTIIINSSENFIIHNCRSSTANYDNSLSRACEVLFKSSADVVIRIPAVTTIHRVVMLTD